MSNITPEQFIDDICIRHHILNRVCLEVTYRCNERCKHCYIFDEKKAAVGELTLEEYLKLFDDLQKLETLEQVFIKGKK